MSFDKKYTDTGVYYRYLIDEGEIRGHPEQYVDLKGARRLIPKLNWRVVQHLSVLQLSPWEANGAIVVKDTVPIPTQALFERWALEERVPAFFMAVINSAGKAAIAKEIERLRVTGKLQA